MWKIFNLFWNINISQVSRLIEDNYSLHFYGFTLSKNFALGFTVRRKKENIEQ